jgi:hypothetical protein
MDSELAQIDIWPKATALARITIVAGLALTCCLACDSGNTSVSSQVPEAPTSTGQAASTAPASQYLSNFDSVASSGSLFAGNLEVNGRHYRNSVMQILDPGPDSVSYNLRRQWRTLEMTLGLSDSSTENEMLQFRVTADDRIIYTGNFTRAQSRHVRLNVAGVLRLDLTTTLVSDYTGSADAVWGSVKLLG